MRLEKDLDLNACPPYIATISDPNYPCSVQDVVSSHFLLLKMICVITSERS